ncbi:hypothetical protein [Gordonia crocea]|uniref:Uncharacterized protein n=1 Tax=Gordonia crocea TaxID=589162 RepID=A0A7I9UWS4_9ACTN|nr:hypothetical protein [Gordonia crocea]GED97230.1 hypothetical protein nbrc107697_12690 [Gordonia crocea]
MTEAQRIVGVDLDAFAADAGLLRSAAGELRYQWADTVALRANAGTTKLAGTADDDPLAVLAALPDKLRADLEVLDGIRSAVEAAWQGVTAVCERVARVAAETLGGAADTFPEDPDSVDGPVLDPAESAGLIVGTAHAGVEQIDRALGELDGELVLIGGH